MGPLKDKAALVTGSTGGLGHRIASALAEAGCHVLLNGLESSEQGHALARELARAYGINAHYAQANLALPSEIAGLVEAAMQRLGALDILVNNAVLRYFAPIEAFAVEWWDEAIAVNVSAAFHLIRLVVPAMRARGYGRIINLASVYGERAVSNRIDYVTSKAAIGGLTRAVALETLADGITCNAVCPGAVLTPFSEQKILELMRNEKLTREQATGKFLHGKQPSGRFIAAEGVASLIVFLCGPGARDITGAVLPVDAGWLAS